MTDKHQFRKVIPNEDGTTDVYEAESWDALVDKIAAAKQAAVAQTRKVLAEKRELELATRADDNALIAHLFREAHSARELRWKPKPDN